jgi:3-dehydroquinate dehydratase/shikimate dehydrogenase
MERVTSGMALFGTGSARVCAVAAAETAGEMARQVRLAWRVTPTVELRLDWLKSNAERHKMLRWVRRQKLGAHVLLATCRRAPGGGKFGGSVDAQMKWLREASAAGCAWCDVEVETLRELPGKNLNGSVGSARVLLSVHDFERTPPLANNAALDRHGADALKVAANAGTIGDSVRLLGLARESKDLVAVPMGELGMPARILALRDSSALAYAPIGSATAPGQVSLDELMHLYRAHRLTRKTKVYGVIGDPVKRSLSPVMHNSGFIARGIDAVYLPILVHDMKDFVAAIGPLGIRGFSVTHPHKQTIVKYLKECDALAADIGAVNTVVVRGDGSLIGSNTDYIGILRALQQKMRLLGSRVLVYGAGGAARAAVFALARSGAQVAVCARRENHAKRLAREVNGESLPRRALRTERFDAILNATPVGMFPDSEISPLSARELNCRVVMDLISRPLYTQLLKIAAQKGLATVSGVEMFLPQGFAQWQLWTGQRPPENAMRRAVLQAVREDPDAAVGTRRTRR